MELNEITERIMGCAIEVHKNLGPGLLESTYEACLAYELIKAGIPFERQKALPLVYKGNLIECGYRLDLIVASKVIVEIKAIDGLTPIHEAQLITYLKLSGCNVGLLINFNVRQLTHGIKRVVNKFLDNSAISAPSAVNNEGNAN
ncbi:MAG: GxxExxY protein [Anaerolinea sp.]|nr:GxxExxY protein [Anaerolinea sp.]